MALGHMLRWLWLAGAERRLPLHGIHACRLPWDGRGPGVRSAAASVNCVAAMALTELGNL
jgi:hypothetical protein